MKKTVKKLSLSRETLKTLDSSRLEQAAGGLTAQCTYQYSNCHCTFECTTNCA
jgi:hypothetical protein